MWNHTSMAKKLASKRLMCDQSPLSSHSHLILCPASHSSLHQRHTNSICTPTNTAENPTQPINCDMVHNNTTCHDCRDTRTKGPTAADHHWITRVKKAFGLNIISVNQPLVYSSRRDLHGLTRFATSQWETALLCNGVSHWLGASLESALD